MNIFETDKHREIREKVRRFAEKEIQPVAQEIDEKEEFSCDLALKMGQIGLFGMQVPKKYGGQELDTLSYIIAVEELARVDSSQAATIAAVNSLGIAPIMNYGTEQQIEKFIPPLCTGKNTWAFGLTEKNAGSDALGTETEAKLKDDQWLINGAKMYITNASSEIAAGVTLQAVTSTENGKKRLSAILVEKGTAGFTNEKLKGKLMWRGTDTGKLFFNNVKVPKENLLGKQGEGAKIMLHTLDAGRLSIAAIGLGLSIGAMEKSLTYSKERKQFGKPIGAFQAVAFKLADMDMKIELARNTLYNACWLKDNNKPYGKQAAMAKLYASEIAREIADEALQIHGANGLFKSNVIERYYRDQRLLQIGEGTSEILRLVISRNLGL